MWIAPLAWLAQAHGLLKHMRRGADNAGQALRTVPQTGDYKRYCSAACAEAHAARDARMAAVYLRIPTIAKTYQTDPDLLRMVLELDARRADGIDAATGSDTFDHKT